MGVAISTLANVSWTNMSDGQPLPAATLNSGVNNVNSLANQLVGVVGDLQASYASASAPTDKPAGKLWFDSGNTSLKLYTSAGGGLKQIWADGTTFPSAVTETFSTSPLTLAVAGTSWAFKGAASKTNQVVGIDQNSYIDGTGTAGTDATAQTVKSITIKGNSCTAKGQGIRVTIIFAANGASGPNVTATLGSGTAITLVTGAGSTNKRATVEWWYIDSTHANSSSLTTDGTGVIGAGANMNDAGYTWSSDMTLAVAQTSVASRHITVFEIIVEQLG